MNHTRTLVARQGGWDQIPAIVQQREDLTGGAKRLYGLLQSVQRMNLEPDYPWLAHELAASVRSIVRWIAQLVAAGLIAVRRRGQGLTNVFRVLALVTSGHDARSPADVTGSQPRPSRPFNRKNLSEERGTGTGHKQDIGRCPRCPHQAHGTTCRCACRSYDSGGSFLETRYGVLRR